MAGNDGIDGSGSLPRPTGDASLSGLASPLGDKNSNALQDSTHRLLSIEEENTLAALDFKRRKASHQPLPDKLEFRTDKCAVYLRLLDDELRKCYSRLEQLNQLIAETEAQSERDPSNPKEARQGKANALTRKQKKKKTEQYRV